MCGSEIAAEQGFDKREPTYLEVLIELQVYLAGLDNSSPEEAAQTS